MNLVTHLQDRLTVVRRDALLVELVVLLCGLGFISTLTIAGSPGWYAPAWIIGLLVTLVSPSVGHLLLPAGLLIWWFSNVPVGSAYSLPASWGLLGMFSGIALLTAAPDGIPISRVVIERYVRRTLTVAGLSTVPWALSLMLVRAAESSALITAAGFLALGAALLALPRLLLSPGRTEPDG